MVKTVLARLHQWQLVKLVLKQTKRRVSSLSSFGGFRSFSSHSSSLNGSQCFKKTAGRLHIQLLDILQQRKSGSVGNHGCQGSLVTPESGGETDQVSLEIWPGFTNDSHLTLSLALLFVPTGWRPWKARAWPSIVQSGSTRLVEFGFLK